MLESFFFLSAHPHAIWVARVITKAAYTITQVYYGWTKAVINKAIQPFLAGPVMQKPPVKAKQGRIHGVPVADGWAGVAMRKSLRIQKNYEGTDDPTYLMTNTASRRVACPRLET